MGCAACQLNKCAQAAFFPGHMLASSPPRSAMQPVAVRAQAGAGWLMAFVSRVTDMRRTDPKERPSLRRNNTPGTRFQNSFKRRLGRTGTGNLKAVPPPEARSTSTRIVAALRGMQYLNKLARVRTGLSTSSSISPSPYRNT